MSDANYGIFMLTLTAFWDAILGTGVYSSDHVATSHELLSYSPFPFNGMTD